MTRLLLPRSRYEEGVELAKASFEAVKYGDPTDIQNGMGPLINARQRELLKEFEDEGRNNNSPETQDFFSKVKGFWDGMKG